MNIQPIVEGHGDVSAIPVLLRRLKNEAGKHDVGVLKPIRQPRAKLVQKDSLQKAVQLAALRPGCNAILIVFDSDDDCPKELAARLQAWACEVSGSRPCHVVMAVKEYEAWFLAALESLRGKRGVNDDAVSFVEPEAIRGAKEAIERNMRRGFSYKETTEQPAFTEQFDMRAAYRNCRSFRKFVKSFGDLIFLHETSVEWPPASWI